MITHSICSGRFCKAVGRIGRHTGCTLLLLILVMAVFPYPSARAGGYGDWTPALSILPWDRNKGTVVYADKLWVLGETYYPQATGVWSSRDGVVWDTNARNQPWGAGANPLPVVFRGSMWAYVAGLPQSACYRQWFSSDVSGSTWTPSGGPMPFDMGRCVVFDDKLWVVTVTGSFRDPLNWHSEVWCSSDCVSWTQTLSNAPWVLRGGYGLTVFNGKMWLLGGEVNLWDEGPIYDCTDVWSSIDGVTWTQETANAEWAPRAGFSIESLGGKLYLLGGVHRNNSFNDVWRSSDAIHWERVAEQVPFSSPYGFRSAVFRNKLWEIGGRGSGNYIGNEQNDVWCSDDGVSWNHPPGLASFYSIDRAFACNGKMWATGLSTHNDRALWCSANGVDWTPKAAPPWAYCSDWGVFNNALCAFDGTYFHFSTDDAQTWTTQRATEQGEYLEYAQMVEFKGEIWRTGGGELTEGWEDGDYYTPCASVYRYSPNTQTLTRMPDAPWGPRMQHASVAFDGKLWVLGGYKTRLYNTAVECNDVWYTTDGQQWVRATNAAPWSARIYLSAVVADNKLWVLGGLSYGVDSRSLFLNDVWCSSDGVQWTQDTAEVPWAPRKQLNSFVYDNKLWVVGGGVTHDGYGSSLFPFNDIWYRALPHFEFTDPPRGGWFEEDRGLNLSAAANTTGAVTYQWTKDGVDIADATNSTFNIPALTIDDQGWYSCIVTDDSKTVHSTPPVYVQVFAAGSLPAANVTALILTALATLCGGLSMLNGRKRKRPLC